MMTNKIIESDVILTQGNDIYILNGITTEYLSDILKEYQAIKYIYYNKNNKININNYNKNKTSSDKRKIKNLHLIDCPLFYLIELLKINKTILYLNLNWNFIDDQEMEIFSEVLKNNKIIQYFGLQWSNYSKMKYLSKSLIFNKTIIELKLIQNNIDDNGVKNLSDMLKKNTTIKSINLHGNKISNKGIRYIADMLKINKTLEEITLYVNNFNGNGTKYILKSLETNNTLVNFKYSFFHDPHTKYFKKLLYFNKNNKKE